MTIENDLHNLQTSLLCPPTTLGRGRRSWLPHHARRWGPPTRKRLGRATALWLVGGILCGPVFAADAAPVPRMTLDECVQLALEQSPLLEATAQDHAIAREATGEARAPYYPTLGLRGGVSRWQNHAFLPSGIDAPNVSSTTGPTDDWSASGFARYLLVDGGVRRAGLAAAKSLESEALQMGEAARLNVAFQVHQAFYQLAAAFELQTVASNSLVNAESHLGLAKSRQAAGSTTQADVLRTQVDADNAKAELIRTKSLIRMAQGELNVAMGFPAERPIEIAPKETRSLSGEELDLAELLEQAIEARPEVTAAQSAVVAAQQQAQAAKGAFGPKIYADANYGWRDDSSALQDEAWFVGLGVELTVFEGLSKRHGLAKARAASAKAAAALEQVRLAVRQEVWSAAAQVQTEGELVQATTTQVRDAEESLRLMASRYKVGAVTVTDLLDAQMADTAAAARHVQARWNYQLAQAALQRATGTLTEDFGETAAADRVIEHPMSE